MVSCLILYACELLLQSLESVEVIIVNEWLDSPEKLGARLWRCT